MRLVEVETLKHHVGTASASAAFVPVPLAEWHMVLWDYKNFSDPSYCTPQSLMSNGKIQFLGSS